MARTRKKPRGRKSAGGRIWARRLLRAVLVTGAVGIVAAAVALAWLWPRCEGASCPSVAALRDYQPPQASRVFDRGGKLV
ncbi:MAG TPA: hypothetical protein VFQ39_19470, partial [Longimicrobium sp.]|nr:hypothetical protein [Longimicrobium sp.]